MLLLVAKILVYDSYICTRKCMDESVWLGRILMGNGANFDLEGNNRSE